jgi:hypothetical protein
MSNASSAGAFITLAQAVEMTTRYRQNKNSVISSSFSGQEIIAICDKFDRAIFDTLLAKANCAAIRIYYGMDESLRIHPIIVAVDSNDADILAGSSAEEGDDIGEESLRCPPFCPTPSSLNE